MKNMTVFEHSFCIWLIHFGTFTLKEQFASDLQISVTPISYTPCVSDINFVITHPGISQVPINYIEIIQSNCRGVIRRGLRAHPPRPTLIIIHVYRDDNFPTFSDHPRETPTRSSGLSS